MTYAIVSVLAAEEGEPNPLLPHLSELIVGAVAFGLLLFFLQRKVFPVFEKTYAERRDAIEGGMERAKEAEDEAKETLAQYREQLADARHEAARLREDAREQGAQIIAEMREQAQSEARRLTEQAHQQIEADRVQAVNSLRAQVGHAGHRPGRPDRRRVPRGRRPAAPGRRPLPRRARGAGGRGRGTGRGRDRPPSVRTAPSDLSRPAGREPRVAQGGSRDPRRPHQVR